MTIVATVPRYVGGLDLGQAQDSTALIFARPSPVREPVYDVGHIERLPLHLRYPAVVAHVGTVVAALRQPVEVPNPQGSLFAPRAVKPDVTLVVDHTGVGRPVFDMLLDAQLDCSLIPLTITGAAAPNFQRNEFGDILGITVPKRDLAAVVQRLLQEARLRIATVLPFAQDLSSELEGFRVKINALGHDSYAAGETWRTAPHDDLVLALAVALWWGEHAPTVEIW